MSTQESSHPFTGFKNRVRSSLRLNMKSSQQDDLSQTTPSSEGSALARGTAFEAQQPLAVPGEAARGTNDRRSQRDQQSSYEAASSPDPVLRPNSMATSATANTDSNEEDLLRTPNLWQRAYKELMNSKDNQTAIGDYDRVLQHSKRKQGNGEVSSTVDVNQTTLGEDAVQLEDARMSIVGKEEEMKLLAVQKLEQMQKGEWIVRWKGEDVFHIRKQVTHIIKVVQQFSGLVDQAANLDRLHAGLPWAGVCVLLSVSWPDAVGIACLLTRIQLIVSDTEERTKAIEGLTTVTYITARYARIESDYTAGRLGMDPKFEDAVVALYSEILMFYAKAACYFARHTLSMVLRNVVKLDDWTGSLSKISKADQTCMEFTSVLSQSALLKGQEEIESLLRVLESRDIQNRIHKILTWLSPIDVGMQHDQVKAKLGARYSASGQWLLQLPSFVSWQTSSEGDFWLRGAVGTGKSSLVSIIIDRLRQQSKNVAFFYCTGALSILNTNTDPNTAILRTLIAQLALSPDGKRIAEEVELHYDKAITLGLAGSQLDHQQAWDLLVQMVDSRNVTTIVIDALDECPKFMELLSQLKALSNKSRKLKYLFSSQLVVPVNQYFPLAAVAMIDSKGNSQDIAAFIQGEVEHFMKVCCGVLDSDLAEDIIETLSAKAEGMFKWAQLCLELILDPEGEENMSEIRSNWEAVKHRPNQGVLVGLIELYEKLYNKHLPPSNPRRAIAQSKAEKTLAWIFCSARPLRLKELSALVEADNEQDREGVSAKDGILKACRSFLFESEAGVIELSHSSVKDYLALKLANQVDWFLSDAASSEISQESMLNQAYETSKYLAHGRVAEDGVTLLLRTNDFKLTSKTVISQQLLLYAAQNWFKHTERTIRRATIPDSLSASIILLFAPDSHQAYENWLRMHDPDNPRKDRKRRNSMGGPTTHAGPLYYALLLGFPTIAERLIGTGAAVNTVGGNFGNALQLACYRGYGDVVVQMLSKGAQIDDPNGIFGTALQAAAARGHLEIVSCLVIDYCADVDAKGGLLGNALQAALARDSYDIVNLLVMHGAKFDREGGRIWKQAYRQLNPKHKEAIINMTNRLSQSITIPKGLTPDQMLLATIIQQGPTSPMRILEGDDGNFSKWLTMTQRERLQRVHERVHTGDMHHLGLVEARLPWIGLHQLLLECQRRPNVKILERIVNIFTEIPHIILSHDSYIATTTMDMGNIELEPILVELYCNILDLIYSLLGAPLLWMYRRRLFLARKMNSIEHDLFEEPLKTIRDLDARARAIEATLEEDTRRAQAEERDKAVRAEISGIKYDLENLQTEMSDVRGMLKTLLTYHGITLPVTGSEQLASERASNANEQH